MAWLVSPEILYGLLLELGVLIASGLVVPKLVTHWCRKELVARPAAALDDNDMRDGERSDEELPQPQVPPEIRPDRDALLDVPQAGGGAEATVAVVA